MIMALKALDIYKLLPKRIARNVAIQPVSRSQ